MAALEAALGHLGLVGGGGGGFVSGEGGGGLRGLWPEGGSGSAVGGGGAYGGSVGKTGSAAVAGHWSVLSRSLRLIYFTIVILLYVV
jgi:hypothetical protein